MEFLSKAWAFIMSPEGMQMLAVIAAALFAVSEGLALIPSVKANSVFQAIQNGIKWVMNKLKPA
jgi:hypothetical protein